MDRRSFIQMLAGFLGMFGFGKVVEAKPVVQAELEAKKLLKWHRWLRKCDEYTMNAFKDTVTIDECGESHAVPVVWAEDDKIPVFQFTTYEPMTIGHSSNPEFEKLSNDPVMETLRDRVVKIEVPKLRLPLINIFRGDFYFADGNICIMYTVTARTLYQEDMNQILEQVIGKFHPAYEYEVGTMQLLSTANNLDEKKDGSALKVNKYRFSIKVTSLPLEKKK